MPDIPVSTQQPGQNLVDLGQGMMKLGGAFGNFANQYDQNQAQIAQTYQRAAATTDYLKMRRYFDDQVASYESQASVNPDHSQIVSGWYDLVQKATETASGMSELPEAKQLFDQYLTGVLTQKTPAIRKIATDGIVADAENTVASTAQEYAIRGDPQAVTDTIDQGISGGIINSANKQAWEDKYLKPAKYVQLLAAMSPLPPEQWRQALSDPDAAKRFDVPQEQVDKLKSYLEDRQNLQESAQKKEWDINNGKLALQASDMLVNYMTQGFAGTGDLKSSDALMAWVGSLNWQGETAGDKQKSWMDAFRSALNGSGDNKDPTKVNAAWDIVFDLAHGWTATQKLTMLDKNVVLGGQLNNGIPGSVYKQITDAVDEFERNPQRKDFIKPIDDFYNAQLTALATKTDQAPKIQDIANKKFLATQAMMEVFRQYPDNANNIWQTKLDTLMSKNVSQHVTDTVAAALTGPTGEPPKYPGIFDQIKGEGISDIMKYEVARQTMTPAAFEADVLMLPGWRTNLQTIQTQQMDMIKRHGVDVKGMDVTMQGNDSFYKDKAGKVYQVTFAQDAGGTIRNHVWVWDGKAWTEVVK